MRRIFWVGALSLLFGLFSVVGIAQTNNNNNNNSSSNNNNSSSNNDSNENISFGAGIRIDASGVLRTLQQEDFSGALRQQRAQAARMQLGQDLSKPSPSRKISLNRLEAELEKCGGVPTDAMRNLAGLLRIQNVYCYPETNDVVIAGPAEGWLTTPQGYVVGIQSNQPTCRLDDLVVALRCYGPTGNHTKMIGCSIDPTQEGLARMQQFVKGVNYQPGVGMERQIAMGQRESLGMQKVTVDGVAPNTHFAQVMVEADYRMKLIGLGLEPQNAGITTFIEKSANSGMSSNALLRWWFVPNYDCVRVSEDGLAAEIVSDGLRLSGADEAVASSGERSQTNRERIHPASRAFVNSFTQRYPQLAATTPIYAELRNVVDMSIVAALIQKNGYYEKSGWKMGFFGDETKFTCENSAQPQWVEPVVNPVVRKNTLRVPIAGGVQIQPEEAVSDANLKADETGKVAAKYDATRPELAADQWWWD